MRIGASLRTGSMKPAATGLTLQMRAGSLLGTHSEVTLERVHAGREHVALGDEWNVLGAGHGKIEPLSDQSGETLGHHVNHRRERSVVASIRALDDERRIGGTDWIVEKLAQPVGKDLLRKRTIVTRFVFEFSSGTLTVPRSKRWTSAVKCAPNDGKAHVAFRHRPCTRRSSASSQSLQRLARLRAE